MEYLIVGGGIIGSAIARRLAIDGHPVTVLEKEAALGRHASGRNSGVLHSGINQKPGSLKARMCVEGNRLAKEYCRARGVPMEECGTIVVARTDEEEQTLERVLRMGTEAGVDGLRMLTREELREREPAVEARSALRSPGGAIVDSSAYLSAVALDAQRHGARYVLGAAVERIEFPIVRTTQGPFRGGHLINCAGLYADRIAQMMGAGSQHTIIPFRGEYMEIAGLRINSMVYPAPDLRYPFLGVHFTKTTGGRVLAGPNATLSFGRESYAKELDAAETARMLATRNFWKLVSSRQFLELAAHNLRTSISSRAFLDEVRSLCPDVTMGQLKPYRSGIRAQMVDRDGRMADDMLVEYTPEATHVLNAVSPGMTCSLAFAEYLVKRIT